MQNPTAKVFACVLFEQEAIPGCHIQFWSRSPAEIPFSLPFFIESPGAVLFENILEKNTLLLMTGLKTTQVLWKGTSLMLPKAVPPFTW